MGRIHFRQGENTRIIAGITPNRRLISRLDYTSGMYPEDLFESLAYCNFILHIAK
jgi:hypothetical protein